jgi:hypothetical protein
VKRGIACLEGVWSTGDLSDQRSVRPLLQYAQTVHSFQLLYRQFATKADFEYLVERLKSSQYGEYRLLYLTCHGGSGVLHLGAKKLTLGRLGKILGRVWQGRDIPLSSCKTLAVSREDINDFLRRTHARSLAGYSKSPYFGESGATDLLVVDGLLSGWSPTKTKKWFVENCPGLMASQGSASTLSPKAPRATLEADGRFRRPAPSQAALHCRPAET